MLLEHNIPVYEKFEAMLEEHGKVILITATGTGKSYITKEYLDRHDMRALVVCPKVVICKNWSKITDRVTPITYSKLSSINKSNKEKFIDFINQYQMIVLDEAHHIGGKEWSKAFRYLESVIHDNNSNCKIVGLTADSKRYFEDGRDIAEEFFDGNTVIGYDQASAIEQGILPRANYVISLFDINEVYKKYKNYRNKISTKLVGQLDYVFKNANSIEDIINRHMPVGLRKGIIFVDRIESIDNALKLFNSIFPNEEILFIHSKFKKEKNDKIVERFKALEHGFIVTVDMLNEGLHIDGINTIIMLRRTESPMVFIQQLGRGLASNGKDVVIFDFVGNASNIKISNNLIDNTVSFGTKHKKHLRKISDQFIVNDYLTPVLNVLHIIEEGISKRYSKSDDDFLRENYIEKGPKYCAEYLNRSKTSIEARAARLGLAIYRKWTDEDFEFLKKNYKNMTQKELAEKLNRSIPSINNKLCQSGLLTPKRFISDEEVKAALASRKENESFVQLSKRTGIYPRKLRDKAAELGIHDSQHKSKYTPEMVEFIKENYTDKGSAYCANHLGISRRTVTNIASKNNIKLKRNVFSEEEQVAIVKEMLEAGFRHKEICERIDKSTSSLSILIRKHNLSNRKIRKWSDKDIDFLKQNYIKLGAKECARILDRSERCTELKAIDLDIVGLKSDKNLRWSKEEKQLLIDNYPKMGKEVYKIIPGKTEKGCINKARRLHLVIDGQKTIPYTDEERLFLTKYYPIIGQKVSGYITDRTIGSIHTFCGSNGIKYSGNKYHWNCSDLVEIDYYLASNNSIDKYYLASKYNKPVEAIDQIIDIFNSSKSENI